MRDENCSPPHSPGAGPSGDGLVSMGTPQVTRNLPVRNSQKHSFNLFLSIRFDGLSLK